MKLLGISGLTSILTPRPRRLKPVRSRRELASSGLHPCREQVVRAEHSIKPARVVLDEAIRCSFRRGQPCPRLRDVQRPGIRGLDTHVADLVEDGRCGVRAAGAAGDRNCAGDRGPVVHEGAERGGDRAWWARGMAGGECGGGVVKCARGADKEPSMTEQPEPKTGVDRAAVGTSVSASAAAHHIVNGSVGSIAYLHVRYE